MPKKTKYDKTRETVEKKYPRTIRAIASSVNKRAGSSMRGMSRYERIDESKDSATGMLARYVHMKSEGAKFQRGKWNKRAKSSVAYAIHDRAGAKTRKKSYQDSYLLGSGKPGGHAGHGKGI